MLVLSVGTSYETQLTFLSLQLFDSYGTAVALSNQIVVAKNSSVVREQGVKKVSKCVSMVFINVGFFRRGEILLMLVLCTDPRLVSYLLKEAFLLLLPLE